MPARLGNADYRSLSVLEYWKHPKIPGTESPEAIEIQILVSVQRTLSSSSECNTQKSRRGGLQPLLSFRNPSDRDTRQQDDSEVGCIHFA